MQRLPVYSDVQVSVFTFQDIGILNSGVANEAIIDRDLDIEVWDVSRVFGRIREVYVAGERQGLLAGIGNVEISDFG